jgi:YgiT-type zinc finger domain-containing protein
MKCFECGGEIVEKRSSVVFYKRDGSPVFFEDVPVGECVQCGEKYLSGAILEKISDVLKCEEISAKKHLTVPVVSLAA